MKHLFLIGVMTCAASMPGCSVNREMPREIVLRPETGEWTLALTDGSSGVVPEYVPVVTLWQDRRYDGLLLVPETSGYHNIVSDARADEVAVVHTPIIVEPSGTGWRIKFVDRLLPKARVADASSHSLPLLIAVDPPGSAGPPPLKAVQEELMYADHPPKHRR